MLWISVVLSNTADWLVTLKWPWWWSSVKESGVDGEQGQDWYASQCVNVNYKPYIIRLFLGPIQTKLQHLNNVNNSPKVKICQSLNVETFLNIIAWSSCMWDRVVVEYIDKVQITHNCYHQHLLTGVGKTVQCSYIKLNWEIKKAFLFPRTQN